MFRKGKALGELGNTERAEKILEDLANKSPSGVCICDFLCSQRLDSGNIDAAAANAELTRLRSVDKERERQHDQKIRGLFSLQNLLELRQRCL